LTSGEGDDPDAGIESVRAAYQAPWRGSPPLREDQTRFFVLGLAPNASRVSIRFWHPTTVAALSTRILQHFEDVEIVRPPKFRRYPTVTDLLRATAVLGKSENIPPNLAGRTLEAIIRGSRYPQALFSLALVRARAEHGLTPDRAAVMKGFLARENRLGSTPMKEVEMALDESNTNVGYLLGRLFAVLEKTQEEALPGINTTIRDRYYGSASSAPSIAFPQLMRLKNYHISKLENRGRAVNLERLLGEILAGVTDFPATLDLQDQGRFSIGYYHQRQAFFTKKPESAEEEKHEHAD
jgi:CRISPR-associated protein Csd1